MSLLNWLFPKKIRRAKRPAEQAAAQSPAEPARAVPHRSEDSAAGSSAPRAHAKGERMARRELLYPVVRECMVKAGVLSSAYKFKVLSLDAQGRQFLLMVDVAREHGGDSNRLSDIEALIVQSAKLRHDIAVAAVYWRVSERMAPGAGTSRAPRVAGASASRPMPLARAFNATAGGSGQGEPSRVAAEESSPGRFDPIEADEVAAFKQALAAGVNRPAAKPTAHAFDGTSVHGPQSYTLLTGFEDTEFPQPRRAPGLSATQYGDLI